MKVVIIDYNAGNFRSVYFALERMGVEAEITAEKEKIEKADKVIFPGVGEAKTTMDFLKKNKLDILIKKLKQPVLGICLGLQLMCKYSEEGGVECLGIFDESVKKFDRKGDLTIKIPEMGWNSIYDLKGGLFNDSLEGKFTYFVHSYYAEIGNNTTSKTDYIQSFSSSLNKGNFYATQFHPEKSGKVGAKILKKFVEL